MSKSQRTDRRVRYTKKALKNALVQLMSKRHVSAISVKALCELADIHRSTFYAHYRDPEDLLHQIEQEVLDTLKLRLEEMFSVEDDSVKSAFPLSRQALIGILEYAKENANLCKVLLSENCDFAFQKNIMELSNIVELPISKAYSQHTREYIGTFGISGSISFFQKWLHDGMIEPPEEIADILLKLVYSGSMSFAQER
ncbi:MAG: TetR/AcrR family transcriptional regulator [Clostridiales Family XIII bacterium]|jgi:AcrR family transcriptional regulator|nr:TetR/AcrR family transcriptional regulator [Clostridiales Family XIII bacterium]